MAAGEVTAALNSSSHDADNGVMRPLADRPGLIAWLATVVGIGAMIGSTVSGPGSGPVWESPTVLFVLVVVTAGLCVVASIAVVVVGMRDDTAEIGILG